MITKLHAVRFTEAHPTQKGMAAVLQGQMVDDMFSAQLERLCTCMQCISRCGLQHHKNGLEFVIRNIPPKNMEKSVLQGTMCAQWQGQIIVTNQSSCFITVPCLLDSCVTRLGSIT